MADLLHLFTTNQLLLAVAVFTLAVWLLQEIVGRRDRVQRLSQLGVQATSEGAEAGFPFWLKLLSWLQIASWVFLVLAIYVQRDGDFALIMVVLVLFCGVVSLIDRVVFHRRRARLLQAVTSQQLLSRSDDAERQKMVDWAQADFTAAEYAKSFFPVLLVVLVLRSFMFEPFKIPSASMVPTLEVNDFILVNKFTYGVRLPVLGTKIIDVNEPARGDVMVFFPPNDKRYFIKRVIGLPGDEIKLVDNQLFVNGIEMTQTNKQPLAGAWPPAMVVQENLAERSHRIVRFSQATPQSNFSATVPEGHYFMMGDNRDNSSDSRFWGMVPEQNIVGQAVAVWMHWTSITSLPSFHRNGAIQ